MVWIICNLVLTNNYFVLLMSDIIVSFLDILKETLCIILYKKWIKIQISAIFLYAFLFSFVGLI